MDTIRKGDKFIILRTHYPENPYWQLGLTTGTHTQNWGGTGKVLFEVGKTIIFDRSNFYDSSFWSIDGIEGRIFSLPQHLLESGIIKPLNK